jgi:hypothetical protein
MNFKEVIIKYYDTQQVPMSSAEYIQTKANEFKDAIINYDKQAIRETKLYASILSKRSHAKKSTHDTEESLITVNQNISRIHRKHSHI